MCKGKGKGHPRTVHEGPEREYRYSPTLSLTSALDGRWVVNAKSRPLYPRERLSTHCIGRWVGPRAGLDELEKSRHPPGFDYRTVQPVAETVNMYNLNNKPENIKTEINCY